MAKKLGKVSQRVLDRFDSEAQQHGYMSSEGSPLQAQRAEERYEKSKAALVRRLLHLERELKFCRTGRL